MEKRLSCLIIEDEPIAAEILKDYIQQLTFLELKAICVDAIYALEWLQQSSIDLILLDINLPKLKGLDFIRTLKDPPAIILTTAYPQYALESYELNVIDYLLKPIEFSRFLQAVNKLRLPPIHSIEMTTPAQEPYYFFNVNKQMVKVAFKDILYVESLKEYVRIFTSQKNIVTKFQLGDLTAILGDQHFLRVHRSFVVALERIDAYSKAEIDIAGKKIPIGRTYRTNVLDQLAGRSIHPQ